MAWLRPASGWRAAAGWVPAGGMVRSPARSAGRQPKRGTSERDVLGCLERRGLLRDQHCKRASRAPLWFGRCAPLSRRNVESLLERRRRLYSTRCFRRFPWRQSLGCPMDRSCRWLPGTAAGPGSDQADGTDLRLVMAGTLPPVKATASATSSPVGRSCGRSRAQHRPAPSVARRSWRFESAVG